MQGKDLPLRVYLRRLIWLCMLPLVLLAVYLGVDSVRKVRAADDRASTRLAREISATVDHTLQARMDALSALSRSPLLDDTQRLADFYRAAQSIRRTFGSDVILADLAGQMLIHTGQPFGSPLPSLPRPTGTAAVPMALASGRPAVGDSFVGPLAKARLVAIAVPVGEALKPRGVLLTIINVRQLQQLVDQVTLPQGWSVSIVDGANEALAVRPVPASAPQGEADDGSRLIVRSKVSPWSVVLVSSAQSRMAPVLNAVQALGVAILGATLIGLLAGTYASRRLAASVASLASDLPAPASQGTEITEIATARRRLEEATRQREAADVALRASDVESQAMFETMSDALIFADSQRRIRRVNPAFVSIFGYTAEEAIGRTTEFLYADPADYLAQGRLRFRPDPTVPNTAYELPYRHKDGREVWTESIGRSIVGPDGAVVGGFALHRDITAQKQARLDLEQHRARAEAELRSRDLRLRGLIDSAMDAMVSINDRHEIVLFNSAAERMFGHAAAAVLGKKLELLIPPQHRGGHDAHIGAFQQAGVTARRMGRLGQVAGLRADGTEFPAEASISQFRNGSETTLTVILRDVTERAEAEQAHLKLEAQLLQAQKMEALGTLATGIAHDFNNILTAIGGNVELARLDAAADSPLQHHLGETARATQRATGLVRQILTFSRRQPIERVVVDLRELALEAVRLLRSTLPASIELATTLAADSPNVLADRTQLHQVLMNLVVNAAQAIGKRPGRVEVSLAGVSLDANATVASLAPGRYARLGVTDNGPGMDAATRQRIFDPFFTTKPVGEGTGLGLAVVDGIVKRLGGAITVYSEPGRGCAFHLYFPAGESDVVVAVEPASSVGLAGGSQRVMFLDDDEALVLIGQAMLQRLGYRVDGHTDSGQALAAFEADPAGFDALISDFNMPGLSGLELAAKVLKRRPDLPVALASGLVTDELLAQAQALGVREVIYKPHSLGDLATALHRMLVRSA